MSFPVNKSLCFLALSLWVCLWSVQAQIDRTDPNLQSDNQVAFRLWSTQNPRNYTNDNQRIFRQNVFNQNFATIRSSNNRTNQTFRLALNKYADLTSDEFAETLLKSRPELAGIKIDNSNLSRQRGRLLIATLQENDRSRANNSMSVDWRTRGFVSPVKDQGDCGACWAFSAISTMETLYARKFNVQKDFSEQNMIDCSSAYNNFGCNGGWMENAFYFVQNHGIAQEKDYPYIGKDQACRGLRNVDKIVSFVDVPNNCRAMMEALLSRPLSVAVEAINWQFYSSGVFNNCRARLDHAVALVGWDATNNFWIVKNSFGTNWGLAGYIHIARGNTCGICQYSTYPQY